MALYEETLTSRILQVVLLVPIISMLAGLYATYQAGEGFEIMLATTVGVAILLLDVMAIRIEIDERELRIRGILGLIVRKTVPIENMASFRVGEGWTSCYGTIHFNLPAKGCVTIHQRKGWTVSFTTNNPEEVARVLATLGVPREP
ncbi:hypothetical protein APY94_05935 [Thermococcus celericrescens]|uniref:Bacterial Pleckstrin homology domain-containing protein n=1 Tax=Thermococcus celericrescens TaxID=227598 RepID=A0A100XXZ4_9EURY|nr:hypothetical protein [Thermococcus celericrescens]KUH33500.1 hypothetical protein APY94_05935 [Thermococcus celericrescens]